MNRMISLLIISLFAVTCLPAEDSGRSIAEKMDNLNKPRDMKSTSSLVLTNSRGKTQKKRIRSIGADDNSLQIIWFLEPARDRGVAFLKIENDEEDDMRLWLPAFKKVRRIRSSQKSDSFMGSDMSYEDMSSRQLNEYSYSLEGEETLENTACWKLISIPGEKAESQYSKIISWVDKDRHIPLKEEFYDLSGRLYKIKTVRYRKIKDYNVPVEIFMEDVIKEHNTRLSIDNIEIDTGVDIDIFQEKNLKRSPL